MKIIAYTGKGGVGKSTLAVETAKILSQYGKTVVLGLDQQHNHADILNAEHSNIDHIEINPKINQYIIDILDGIGLQAYSEFIGDVASDFVSYMNLCELFRESTIHQYSYYVLDYPPNHAGNKIAHFPDTVNSIGLKVMTAKERVKRMMGRTSATMDKIDYINGIHKDMKKFALLIQWYCLGIPTELGFIETTRTCENLLSLGNKVNGIIMNMVHPVNRECRHCMDVATLEDNILDMYLKYQNEKELPFYQIPYSLNKEKIRSVLSDMLRTHGIIH